jgi:hypothetical protein
MTARDPAHRPDATDVAAALGASTDDPSAPMLRSAIEPMALTPTETLGLTPTEVLPTTAGSTRLVPARPRTAGRSRALLWALVGIGLLVGAVAVKTGADDNPSPLLVATTAATSAVAPTTVAPAGTPPPQPAVDCAALRAEKASLEAQIQQIGKPKKHGREARQQSGAVDARQQQIDAQLAAAHCP